MPHSGETSCGAARKKNTMPAAALLPVSSFAQMPSASQSAVSPKTDSVWRDQEQPHVAAGEDAAHQCSTT